MSAERPLLSEPPADVRLCPIPGLPNDDYVAGSDGAVYSRTYYAGPVRKDRGSWYRLTPHVTRKGYLTVSVCHQNVKTTRLVHRLVCAAFHGAPADGAQVRHLDGNPAHNHPDNLRWGTAEENWQDRRAHGRTYDGERHHASKFTNDERERIREMVRSGQCSQRQAARLHGVAPSTIQAMCRQPEVSRG